MPHYENEPKIDTGITTGDWRDQLYQDGYYVLKGVLTPEKAQSYVDRMFQWLETFPYGFKSGDPSTWGREHLPDHIKYCKHIPITGRSANRLKGWNVLWLPRSTREDDLGCEDVSTRFDRGNRASLSVPFTP